MRPKGILAFVFSVLGILFLLSLFFPEQGIRLNDQIKLHFITLDEILGKDSVRYADISGILSSSSVLDDSVYLAMLESPGDAPRQRAVPDGGTDGGPFPGPLARDTVRADESSLRALVYPLEYPDGDSTLLYPFFRRMSRLKNSGGKLRIMHYGDSQIEGDRITSYIRFKLQDQFGGSGIGMQPAISLYGYQLSLKHTNSENWLRFTAFGNTDSTLEHNRYGILGSFARFSPYPDSLTAGDTTTYEAWIRLEQSKRSYYISRMYRYCRIHYGNVKSPVFFEIYADGELYDADYLEAGRGIRSHTWKFSETPKDLLIRFRAEQSPDFYAIELDNPKGVSVDNIPMRGSAGLVFSKIDGKMLKEMYRKNNTGMLLLQFGGNVVPYISDKTSYYEQWFYRELSRLKSLLPDVPIIVIGVADMSVKEKDRFVTYPNLEKVRDALRNAAFSADCVFWDMYSAMGGENSMPSWVYAQPALASTDFVHFNEKGARVLAEMFYNALINENNRYNISRP